MIPIQSPSPIPTTKKPSIPPSMDARLIRLPTTGSQITKRTRSLVIINSETMENSWQVNDDSKVYYRHRTSVKENIQSALNAAWKEEDPDFYEWATEKAQDGKRNRSSGHRKSLPSSGKRLLLKALSFNSKAKISKGAAESKDPSSMRLTSTTWHGNSATPSNQSRSGLRKTGRSKSFCHRPKSASRPLQKQNPTGEFLTVPLHLKVVSKQAVSSPPNLRRSASAREAAKDYDCPSPPTFQRSRSALVSSQSTRLSSGPLSPPTLKRSVSATVSGGGGPTSPTLERATRSARVSRSNSLQLRDFFGTFHRSQSELQVTGNKTRVHKRRTIHGDASGIFKDKEKGYISSFLGSDVSQQNGFRRSSGWLV